MNKVTIDTCNLCAHCSTIWGSPDKIEVFCNQLDKNETLGYATVKDVFHFPIPNDCPLLKNQ